MIDRQSRDRFQAGIASISDADIGDARQEYSSWDVCQLANIVDASDVSSLVASITSNLSGLSVRTEHPAVARAGREPDWGVRMGRVDPGYPKTPLELRSRTATMFRDTGLSAFNDAIGMALKPVVERVTARRLKYDRAFFLLYREGDFLSPHTDARTGSRVHAQFPATFNCSGALRVFGPEHERLLRDDAGALRILGAEAWHEVLPVLAIDRALPCLRVIWTFRFEEEARAEAEGSS